MVVPHNALGNSVPPYTEHAISVSLPTWKDTVGYEEGDKRVVDAMQTGYPRFFVHLSIQKLAKICEQKFGTLSERALLLPSAHTAEACRAFLQTRNVSARVVQLTIPNSEYNVPVHAVLLPADDFPIARQFWQHTGHGISSRLAEHCLGLLGRPADIVQPASPPLQPRVPLKKTNRHYAAKPKNGALPVANGNHAEKSPERLEEAEVLEKDYAVYLEERYGRNLNRSDAANAKTALRRRIAGLKDAPGSGETGGSIRGAAVTEGDVFLYQTGMTAIWNAHQLALGALGERKSICFGFPYTDTLKILEKWGPGCYFLGLGLDSSIDELEEILAKEQALHPDTPPVLALFTEFPSNPLLRSANLPRLRQLADKYNFLIVIDDTIGNFVNVEVLPYADIVVTSLTKVFSGDSNVMGGSLVLNPARKHYATLKAHLTKTYEDTYFDEDAIFMERNSRDFIRRVAVIDANAEAVCDLLHAASQSPAPVVTRVFYPKWETRENYEMCRIKDAGRAGGFGGLFSLDFASFAAARAFFDALPCYKGPSLGTNFTLACPYAVLAHYAELDWAKQYGVVPTLVRVSVGLEERGALVGAFESALRAAEEAQHAEVGGKET
ncbi:hypothetical protein EVG20_g5903 [Dentipellis fragilis]|uniref:cystathionine gamma-synthase n=1 Tax=Dentipellis fragilis TaxID=205917 RepID=A0A4Y9YS72_9AGAM|nr:hypothetical protein EVG20_g5903 [Dentipellis fragilis]